MFVTKCKIFIMLLCTVIDLKHGLNLDMTHIRQIQIMLMVLLNAVTTNPIYLDYTTMPAT